MPSSKAVLARMDDRISGLLGDFERCVRCFVASERFIGPSWYFHRKTISRRAAHQTVTSLLQDDLFFDDLYATLTAWGLHRMGPGNTKLRELGEIRESIRGAADRLDELVGVEITTVGQHDTGKVVDQVRSVLSKLRVSVATAQIVANSKALHHLLPALVPPMDREYTFRFFYQRTMLTVDERTAFVEMFTRLLRVASAKRSIIQTLIDGTTNTSQAKVVDNAIVGYMIAREGAVPPIIGLEPSALK